MPVTVKEHFKAHGTVMNGEGKFTSIEATYIVQGTDSEETALESVKGAVSSEMEDLPLDELEIAGREGLTTFFVTVKWAEDSSGGSSFGGIDDDKPTVTFDCGGGTMHLTHSYSQRIEFGTKDAGGAIGWNGKTGAEMSITGIDVPTAQLRESYTRTMRMSELTTTFKRKAAKLVGKVNSGTFKGWEKGEVMFLGLSYSSPDRKSAKVKVVFNFAIQVNEEVTVCGKKVKKLGFEYAWGLSSTGVDAKGVPKAEVEAIYVDQVCRYDSFSALGL